MGEVRQSGRAHVDHQRCRAVLAEVTEAVSRAVDAYREQYFAICEKEVHFSASPANGFSLERRRYPAIALDCQLGAGADTIVASYRSLRDSTSPTVERRVEIRLRVDANDRIAMETENRTFATAHEVAQFLVQEILE
jgi:hypothetical protein